jgi:hypothetical protein
MMRCGSWRAVRIRKIRRRHSVFRDVLSGVPCGDGVGRVALRNLAGDCPLWRVFYASPDATFFLACLAAMELEGVVLEEI